MKRIAIFCAASSGNNPAFTQATREFISSVVRAGLGIVYGGGQLGLMGTVANTALAQGGEVIGVIPRALVEKELAHPGLSDLRIVNSMHERKALMESLSDSVVALPGGLGTLDEFFEILTWAQLRMHQKPCGVLNTLGFYDPLLQFLDSVSDAGFLRVAHRDMIQVASEPEALLAKLARYRPVEIQNWIREEIPAP